MRMRICVCVWDEDSMARARRGKALVDEGGSGQNRRRRRGDCATTSPNVGWVGRRARRRRPPRAMRVTRPARPDVQLTLWRRKHEHIECGTDKVSSVMWRGMRRIIFAIHEIRLACQALRTLTQRQSRTDICGRIGHRVDPRAGQTTHPPSPVNKQ